WYDLLTEEVTLKLAELMLLKNSPMKLIVGPQNHIAMLNGNSVVREDEFGEAAAWGYPVYNRERLRRFDRWLKDAPTGVEADPTVRIFVMGGGEGGLANPRIATTGLFGTGLSAAGHLQHGGNWREEEAWPLRRALQTPYYLHPAGGLSTAAPEETEAASQWTHDPERPVPTLGASVAPFLEWQPLLKGISADYLITRGRMTTFV